MAKAAALGKAVKKLGLQVKQQHREYVVVAGALDSATLKKLTRLRLRRQGGGVYNSRRKQDRKLVNKFRSSNIAWLLPKRLPWLTKRLAAVSHSIARAKWPKTLPARWKSTNSAQEPIQDAEYPAGGHYGAWHVDSSAGSATENREISLVMMVSPSGAFTGGEFQVKVKQRSGKMKEQSIRLEAADAIVFPAKKLLHRVKEVKSGRRRTLVYWASRCVEEEDSHFDSDDDSEA
eukprot:TRINITY_DN20644_c0_g1_i1.p1 TRINITY_DN20644_c0_g1~~TRINITY_DN20644_c0_g1_i1.p1  ORF type:complete len:233 (-),score=70.78 TRINITY_DN20644_c0_g1_i1:173-871(-)